MDFWVSLCSTDVHPVGWAARQELTISPPKCIEKTQVNQLFNDYIFYFYCSGTGRDTSSKISKEDPHIPVISKTPPTRN